MRFSEQFGRRRFSWEVPLDIFIKLMVAFPSGSGTGRKVELVGDAMGMPHDHKFLGGDVYTIREENTGSWLRVRVEKAELGSEIGEVKISVSLLEGPVINPDRSA